MISNIFSMNHLSDNSPVHLMVTEKPPLLVRHTNN